MPRSFASSLNCFIAAIAVSVVFLMSLNVGARELFAKASNATVVSLAVIPVCAKTLETSTSDLEETPREVERRVISSLKLPRFLSEVPVT